MLRTKLFQMLPWDGGLNTADDSSMIGPDQLTVANNVVKGVSIGNPKREGINHNWDSGSNSTSPVVGLHDFWYGTTAKVQKYVSVLSAGNVYAYNTGGVRSTLTDVGKPWSGTLTGASTLTFNNQCLIAPSGVGNTVKKWDGTGNVKDLKATLGHKLVSRASSGTTRTLVLTTAFLGVTGDTIVIENATDKTGTAGQAPGAYNGTYTVNTVTTSTLTNDTITYTALTSATEAAGADTTLTVDGIAPQASMLQTHLGRIWCNDKTNPDRLHFSSTSNHEEWLGVGDSGALYIGVGDGDPYGITAIFPSFQGDLFVAKRTKLYRITGFTPEDFQITQVSNGIGCVSHMAVCAVDQNDMVYVSDKGIHSLTTSANYGDYTGAFLSEDIQRTFNDTIDHTLLPYCRAAYLSSINSVAFAFSGRGATSNDSLYLINYPRKQWYAWPNLSCTSLIVANDPDKKRFYLGTSASRISKSFTGNNYDLTNTGAQLAIPFTLTTGTLYLDNNAYSLKGIKKFILYYKPEGTHTVTATITVDNNRINSSNVLSFSETSSTSLLGVNFILGVSTLGYNVIMGPYIRSVDGYGRGFKVSITQTGINEKVELQGFAIEYEGAGTNSETVLSN